MRIYLEQFNAHQVGLIRVLAVRQVVAWARQDALVKNALKKAGSEHG